MKFMLIMRTVDQVAVERMAEADFNEMIAAMGTYNESMINAGVLSDGAGLADPSEGAVVDFSGSEPTTAPGAYGNLRELFNRFWVIEVASQGEAIDWAKPSTGRRRRPWTQVPRSRSGGSTAPRTSPKTTNGSRKNRNGSSRVASTTAESRRFERPCGPAHSFCPPRPLSTRLIRGSPCGVIL